MSDYSDRWFGWDCDVSEAVSQAAEEGPFGSERDLEDAICRHLHPEGCEPATASGRMTSKQPAFWLARGKGTGMSAPRAPDVTSALKDDPDGAWGPMIEVKVRDEKIYESVWDLFKLINLLKAGHGKRGYLCVQANPETMRSGAMGTELFQPWFKVDPKAPENRETARLVGANPFDPVRKKNWIKYLAWESAGYPLQVPEYWMTDFMSAVECGPSSALYLVSIKHHWPYDWIDTSTWFPGTPPKNPDGSLDYGDFETDS